MELQLSNVVTKSGISDFVINLENQIKEGKISPLNVWVNTKAIESLAKEITSNKQIKESAMNERSLWNSKESCVILGAKISAITTKTDYEYSGSAFENIDALIEVKKQELKALTDQLKEMQLLAEKTKISIPYVDTETGQEFIINPARAIGGADSFSVTLSK